MHEKTSKDILFLKNIENWKFDEACSYHNDYARLDRQAHRQNHTHRDYYTEMTLRPNQWKTFNTLWISLVGNRSFQMELHHKAKPT